MRTFGLVRIRPAGEVYASMSGVVDPQWRHRGIGGALLHWQTERARHLIGAERAGAAPGSVATTAPAHVVTTVLEEDERMQKHIGCARAGRSAGPGGRRRNGWRRRPPGRTRQW